MRRTLMRQWEKYRPPLETFVFPALLFLYAFVGVRQGVDVTDTTYALGNYQYMDTGVLDRVWLLATWLPNLLGAALMRLPFGDTMLGMQCYTTLVICLTALATYVCLKRLLPGWSVFLGEWIAVSLCWCPRVILYNYLTYLLLTLGALTLLRALYGEAAARRDEKPPVGMSENNKMRRAPGLGRKECRLYFLAGFLLGLNVMVRFPNVTQAALIAAVWYYGALAGKGTARVLRETALCAGGWLTGVLLPLAAITALYGVSAYGGMLRGLFGMTESAAEYTLSGMLLLILRAYKTSLFKMLPVLLYTLAGAVLFRIRPEKGYFWKRALFCAGILLLFRYYFAKGIFTRSYYYYDSIYEPAMMFLIFGIALLAADAAGIWRDAAGECSEEEIKNRTLSVLVLAIILITPLGSNNYTYPVLNNLFIAAPAIIGVLHRTAGRAAAKRHGAWKWTAAAVIALLTVQGTLFHASYAFADGTDGARRGSEATGIAKLAGMRTTEENAAALRAVRDTLAAYVRAKEGETAPQTRLLQFGRAPGLSYILDISPAIFSTWPNLDSNTTERFAQALEALDASGERPLVVVRGDFEGEVHAEEKYALLLAFMERNGYDRIYSAYGYEIFADE